MWVIIAHDPTTPMQTLSPPPPLDTMQNMCEIPPASSIFTFIFNKSILSYFPSVNTVVALNKCLYSIIHRTCFLTFNCTIMSIVTFLSTLLSIPCATLWYFQLVIYLSNDFSKNPGPQFHNNFLNFMSWNLNSIAKDNFHRVSLIEAHNSIFYYDLISICETCLNDSVELPETLLDEYTFVYVNNPANTRRGGVGLSYKNSIPVVIRNDLSFGESIVVELKFGRIFLLFCIEVLPLITTRRSFKPFC